MLHQCAPTYWAKAQHEGKSCLEQLFLVPSNAEGCREAQREGKCAKLLYRHPLLVPAIPAASRIASSPIRPPGKPPWKHLHCTLVQRRLAVCLHSEEGILLTRVQTDIGKPSLTCLLCYTTAAWCWTNCLHTDPSRVCCFNGTSSYYWELYTLKKWCHSRHNFSTSQFFTWKTR